MSDSKESGTEQREIAQLLLASAELVNQAANRIERTDRHYGLKRDFLAEQYRERAEYLADQADVMRGFADEMDQSVDTGSDRDA